MRVPVMVGALLALAALGGCSSAGGQPTGAPTAAPTAGQQAIQCNATGTGTAVEIKNVAFTPISATVAVNGELDWTNHDSVAHTVTFDNGPDCGTVSPGGTVKVMFTVAGEYSYHCAIHPSMTAAVLVE